MNFFLILPWSVLKKMVCRRLQSGSGDTRVQLRALVEVSNVREISVSHGSQITICRHHQDQIAPLWVS